MTTKEQAKNTLQNIINATYSEQKKLEGEYIDVITSGVENLKPTANGRKDPSYSEEFKEEMDKLRGLSNALPCMNVILLCERCLEFIDSNDLTDEELAIVIKSVQYVVEELKGYEQEFWRSLVPTTYASLRFDEYLRSVTSGTD